MRQHERDFCVLQTGTKKPVCTFQDSPKKRDQVKPNSKTVLLPGFILKLIFSLKKDVRGRGSIV